MVFKFAAARPNYAISIQLAGDSGTEMHRFVGLSLGDARDRVIRQLGQPSHVERNPELKLDVLEFTDRNYSVEIDSTGRLFSIQILGYDGFPQYPRDSVPALTQFASGLSARDLDQILESLTPDFEIFQGDSAYRFQNSARRDVADTAAAVARLLYAGTNSVAHALANQATVRSADLVIRVYERAAPGFAYKFSSASPLAEIVYQRSAGEWRVWEIRYR